MCLRYADANGDTANTYPANPNGSPDGITGVTSEDGRATILMPHPERAFRTVQLSWHPREWGEVALVPNVCQRARLAYEQLSFGDDTRLSELRMLRNGPSAQEPKVFVSTIEPTLC